MAGPERPSALVVQPTLRPPSGSVGVAAWMIQALRDSYDLQVLSWNEPDPVALDEFYGTSLVEGDLCVRTVPGLVRPLRRLDPDPFSFQPMGVLQRVARTVGRRFDVLICPSDEADLGSPGLQYIHFPHLARHWQRDEGLTRVEQLRLRARPWRLISGFDFERMRRNVTLVNSEWTRRKVQESLDVDARTVYPPAAIPSASSGSRANAFVCISRLDRKKNLPRIVSIVARLRDLGYDVGLTVIASRGHTPDEAIVLPELRALQERCPWLTLRIDVSRSELAGLLRSHRFGIHGRVGEHFGIAIAEMVAAGCIPFVAPDGGQSEIVRDDPRLIYESEQDAVAKIVAVLDSERLADELLAMLEPMRSAFDPERFMSEVRDVVDGIAGSNGRRVSSRKRH